MARSTVLRSYMAANWAELLAGADPQRDADDVLAGAVMYEIHRLAREHRLTIRLAEARLWLDEVRDALDRIDGGCGLHQAMAALQDRQCEVYLLRECMSYTANFTAVILGIHPRTVDYHFRRANEALAADLTARHLLHPHVPGPRREGGHR
ncbi:hypothetical protein [Kitasatospora sp. NPDC056531]|uniref:hypothetical protein n=1 Tax=Kitasatospora sp. NPDC056531 TaxID=3345856 RepID=UPI0036886F93